MARPHSRKSKLPVPPRSFLGDVLRELAARAEAGASSTDLMKNATLLDAADREALIVMATAGVLYDLANFVTDDDYNQAFAQLGRLQDPQYGDRGAAWDALEAAATLPDGFVERSGVGNESHTLSDAVLEHRMIAERSGFLLGVSIGRRIGGGR